MLNLGRIELLYWTVAVILVTFDFSNDRYKSSGIVDWIQERKMEILLMMKDVKSSFLKMQDVQKVPRTCSKGTHNVWQMNWLKTPYMFVVW